VAGITIIEMFTIVLFPAGVVNVDLPKVDFFLRIKINHPGQNIYISAY
jgi:hypothetical protein